MTETFRVWAPVPRRVRVLVDGATSAMEPAGGGWWQSTVDSAGPGSRYGFLLDDATEPVADPRSLWQPDGVHGLSAVYHHSYEWSDQSWPGRALPGGIVYELHIGTFTPDGTLDSAIGRLDHLVELGVDFVELMPMNAFNGVWGWGYDGVLWYAVHQPYGGPDALKRFVEACHQRGLAVILDAVYNHLGPSGGHLDEFGPYFAGRTIWGPTLNLSGPDSDEVRRYVLDNVTSWLRDFHLDGLRLDAVHALSDNRAVHILEEMAAEVDVLSAQVRRPLTLIAESDLNDPRVVTPRPAGYGLAAQWNDDIHHCLRAALTGERRGYYVDFGSIEALAKALERVFFHDGTYSTFRRRHHGRPVDTLTTPAHRFLAYTCDHDQIGNRAAGDRLSTHLSVGLLGVAAAIVLTSPYTPMLFMGEEWGSRTPFQFFSSHPEPALVESTRAGRIAEFAEHGWDAAEVADPMDPATFQRSKLDWSEVDSAPLLEIYRKLIALRRSYGQLSDPRLDRFSVDFNEDERWLVLHRGDLRVIANLSTEPRTVRIAGELLLTNGPSTVDSEATTVGGECFAVVQVKDR
ncbi:malto-oligosyltrehalose trehalohydrolase [Fodinicola acaciae]|uniref:malto-oligosyltrehalose trehalohydrolase n=1 Tax=Fodinicola acaciae TaxID=2681555 RepID=UPI0013D3711C|nr:malto-oligosyltrehalose trehalohydrolase [Fodinicola acaciae]